jgi:succinyl-diaminopimelate desuccinylase
VNEVIGLLRDLIRLDTTNPPGAELALAKVLGNWLEDRGLRVEIDEYQPGRANLMATLEGKGARALMLNTHIDVVPAGEGWTTPPFEAALRGGILYGRGAADAKGSLAAMAAALVRLAQHSDTPVPGVVLAAVADEEVGSGGARHLLEERPPDAVVIGEPTNLRLMTAHKGSWRPVVEIVGRSAHAAQPQLGSNALEGAAQLLVGLSSLTETLARCQHPLVGSPTLVPVLIDGGEAPNSVPERCRITFDRRMIPGESESEVAAVFEAFLADFEESHPDYRFRLSDFAPSTGGPSETSPDDAFVVSCRKALARVGLDEEIGGLIVNCDMTHFRARGIPTVVCGPGAPHAMHVVDEHVAVDDVLRAVDAYCAMAEEYFRGDP